MTRITLTLFRFELVVSILVCVATSVAAVVFARQLIAATPTPDCLALTSGGPIFGGDTARCPSLAGFQSVNALAGPLLAAMGLLPFAAAGLVGSQLVATELDRETAALAWSLAPSRRRWLLDRILPPLVVLIIGFALVATTSAYLESARSPAIDLSRNFNDFGLWGPGLLSRGFVAFAVGLLAGSVTGRVLPSLIVTVGVGALLFVALPTAVAVGVKLDALVSTETPGNEYPLHVIGGWRNASGVVLTDEDARKLVPPEVNGAGAAEDWLSQRFTAVGLGVRGGRLPEILARESGVLIAGGLILIVLTGSVLDRRRPR